MSDLAKHGQFSIIPARALDDIRFDSKDRHLRIYLVLGTYANRDGWCFPSLGTISKRVGVSPATVSTTMKDLEEWGYILVVRSIHKEGESNQSNRYRIIYDAELPKQFDRVVPDGAIKSTSVEIEKAIKQTSVPSEKAIKSTSVEIDTNVPIERPNITNAPVEKEIPTDDNNGIDFPKPATVKKQSAEEFLAHGVESMMIGIENARGGRKKGISNPRESKFSPVELKCGESIALALGKVSSTDFDCMEGRRLLAKGIPAEKIIWFCQFNQGEFASKDKETNARWVFNAIDDWQSKGYPELVRENKRKIEISEDGGFYA